MAWFRGSLAHQLDFADLAAMPFSPEGPALAPRRTELRLTANGRHLRGPDKYKVLDQRRRRAQIEARRVLGLF